MKISRFITAPALLLTLGLFGCQQALDTPDTATGTTPDVITAQHAEHEGEVIVKSVIENGKYPTVAIDRSSGKQYLSFFRNEEGQHNVYVIAKEEHAKAWSTPVRINSIESAASAHGQAPAQVRVGPEGNVYVVWTSSIPIEGRRFPASNLLFAKSTDGGATFSVQKPINTDWNEIPASHTFHDVEVGPDGTIYVSWLDSRERYRAMAHSYERSAATPIRKASLGSMHVSHAMHEPGTQVWVAHSSDHGDTFSAGTVVAKETCQCCRTSLAVDANGDVYVAWRHIFPGIQRDMAIAKSTDGGKSFNSPQRIYADNWAIEGCPHSGPSLEIDGAGKFHVGWYTGEESKPGLYYSTSSNGTDFASPTALVTGVGVSQIQLDVASGEVWAAWEDKSTHSIRMLHHGSGDSFEILEGMAEGVTSPALSVGTSHWVLVSQDKSDIHLIQGTLDAATIDAPAPNESASNFKP